MKTIFTVFISVILSVTIMFLIIQHQHDKTDTIGTYRNNNQNYVMCGLDINGHIIPDGKGSCVSPPPQGYIIDAPIPDGAVIEKYPLRRSVSADEIEQICPWKSLVSKACQDLYILPHGVSCIGKPVNTCLGGEKP